MKPTNSDIVPNRLGEYIYMGMGHVNGHRVCMSVAYKLDYSVKKAIQFEKASNKLVVFDKVNKIKIGCLEPETSFERNELQEYEKLFGN
jgi:hypothetical protein